MADETDPPNRPVEDTEPVEADEDRRPATLSWPKIAGLLLAVAFLGGAVGWAISQRDSADRLSSTDVGFLQDMNFHHDQATQLSLILLHKADIDRDLRGFAQEFIVGQRFEQGVFNATLVRDDRSAYNERSAMGWMGRAIPRDRMEGLASEKQIGELRDAEGEDAEALFIALMSEHHLGGLHMADYEARHGKDAMTVNLAKAIVRNQRSEVIDMDRLRKRLDLPVPKGFEDPTKDQRLNPQTAHHED